MPRLGGFGKGDRARPLQVLPRERARVRVVEQGLGRTNLDQSRRQSSRIGIPGDARLHQRDSGDRIQVEAGVLYALINHR